MRNEPEEQPSIPPAVQIGARTTHHRGFDRPEVLPEPGATGKVRLSCLCRIAPYQDIIRRHAGLDFHPDCPLHGARVHGSTVRTVPSTQTENPTFSQKPPATMPTMRAVIAGAAGRIGKTWAQELGIAEAEAAGATIFRAEDFRPADYASSISTLAGSPAELPARLEAYAKRAARLDAACVGAHIRRALWKVLDLDTGATTDEQLVTAAQAAGLAVFIATPRPGAEFFGLRRTLTITRGEQLLYSAAIPNPPL